jgi:hypothetical protein
MVAKEKNFSLRFSSRLSRDTQKAFTLHQLPAFQKVDAAKFPAQTPAWRTSFPARNL